MRSPDFSADGTPPHARRTEAEGKQKGSVLTPLPASPLSAGATRDAYTHCHPRMLTSPPETVCTLPSSRADAQAAVGLQPFGNPAQAPRGPAFRFAGPAGRSALAPRRRWRRNRPDKPAVERIELAQEGGRDRLAIQFPGRCRRFAQGGRASAINSARKIGRALVDVDADARHRKAVRAGGAFNQNADRFSVVEVNVIGPFDLRRGNRGALPPGRVRLPPRPRLSGATSRRRQAPGRRSMENHSPLCQRRFPAPAQAAPPAVWRSAKTPVPRFAGASHPADDIVGRAVSSKP